MPPPARPAALVPSALRQVKLSRVPESALFNMSYANMTHAMSGLLCKAISLVLDGFTHCYPTFQRNVMNAAWISICFSHKSEMKLSFLEVKARF